jgi:hypothetical protein
MNSRDIIVMVTASFVLIAAASGRPTTSPGTYRTHFVAPIDADQKIDESFRYEPSRSPGFDDMTGS